MKENRLCFIDFETTGSDTINDYPLHFGAILVTIPDFEILEKFETHIQPPKGSVSTEIAYNIHKIRTEDIMDSPSFKKVLTDFFRLFGTDYSFAGWNICFDITVFRMGCIRSNLNERYMKINYRHLDVQSIAQALYNTGRLQDFDGSMTSLCNHFNLSRNSKHTGLQDSILAMQIYKKLLSLLALSGLK